VKVVSLNYGAQPVTAANVSYLPGANVYAVSNNVQAAIDELDVALRGPVDGGTF
jgi:multidrug efflux pump subunit AcrB